MGGHKGRPYGEVKVCHSERSEESALGRLNPELQILRFAQDESKGLGMTR